jgi:hypothetical protein
MVLKRIGPVSVARIAGTIYAIFGLIAGALFSMISMIGLVAMPPEGPAVVGWMFGVGAIVILPLFYGVIGFLAALIGAALYNVFANLLGGIELQLE